jgi:hypothetical protein
MQRFVSRLDSGFDLELHASHNRRKNFKKFVFLVAQKIRQVGEGKVPASSMRTYLDLAPQPLGTRR